MSTEEDERRLEISMFSAMANDDFNSGTFDAHASAAVVENGPVSASDDPSNNMSAQIGMGADPTGTFTLQESTDIDNSQDYRDFAKNHNLEAAAAALDEDDNPGVNTNFDRPVEVFLSRTPDNPANSETFPKLEPRTTMHSQKIYLPKYLFFGHELPPRVTKEARDIVGMCPKDRPFPPEVQNVISAIRTYGHGFDLLRENSEPSPYVVVFCPKWSETIQSLSSGLELLQEISHDKSEEGRPVAPASFTRDLQSDGGSFPGQAIGEETKRTNERDLFSLWARGDDGASASPRSSASSDASLTRSSLLRDNSGGSHSSIIGRNQDDVMSDRKLFSQWARGESRGEDGFAGTTMGIRGNSVVLSRSSSIVTRQRSVEAAVNVSGTLMNFSPEDNSDDDELVVSELKKKVGMNEHLKAALAYLEEDKDEPRIVSAAVDDSAYKMNRVPLTPDGGRPLTNHELMNGVAPLFGCDDSSLPTEADLGIHETRDEQQRWREQRRNQAIVENCCPQNIFGPLSCPCSASNPDDNHSWTSRTPPSLQPVLYTGPQQGVPSNVDHSGLGVLPDIPEGVGKVRPGPKKSASSIRGSGSSVSSAVSKVRCLAEKRLDPRLRYGWWNVPEEDEPTKIETDGFPGETDAEIESTHSVDLLSVEDKQQPLVLPPYSHPATNVLLHMGLEPTPEKLQEQNRPLFQMHPATTIAQSLPFLSDRHPSYRYLQIDTQAVGFLGLGGEVEPLFCSLAIYHVETIGQNSMKDSSMAPIPDLQRCGKVTETLHFDVVSDQTIEQSCRRALWPISSSSEEMLLGTRCGVFPLPSNLNIHNLYAILIVHKVVSDGSDFEPYLKADGLDDTPVDLETLRANAEQACNRQGSFIMPFAFGVAPLLQVFGADIPVTPSSRAVQIPLFRFSSNQGERQIIDHIMVMLYPRADHKASGIGGPAPVTNKGTAMLVMRNFGYLGLHSVVQSKSSLARDRLVDFTREIQLRRREDNAASSDVKDSNPDLSVVSKWHNGFIAEPTTDGGRNKSDHVEGTEGSDEENKSLSPLYAQELAPLRLHACPYVRSSTSTAATSQRGRGHNVSGDDIEPYFHTSFCNELLCHPRLLHNCPKGNIVLKVELREVEWIPEYDTFVANLPSGGPSIHNSRRGPHLVQGSYSSCSSGAVDPFFLDEFKVRLPLVLDRILDGPNSKRKTALVFIVYRLSFSSRKKLNARLRTKKIGGETTDFAGEVVGDTDDSGVSGSCCHLMQLACGYLPLTQHSCIIPDGSHEIRMTKIAYHPRKEAIQHGKVDSSSLILADLPDEVDRKKLGTDDHVGDDESASSVTNPLDTVSATSAADSLAVSEMSDNSRSRGKGTEPMCLQVRIAVHSSIHAQNATLHDFLGQGLESTSGSSSSLSQMLQHSRDELFRLSSLSMSHSDTSQDSERLQIAVVDVAKPSICPVSGVSDHLIRVVSCLWKVIVFGCGEANPRWANPGAFLPLRVQAFATLLQVLGTTSVYFSKRGLSQLDGSSKWNLILLGRILALVFDEKHLFGETAEESLDERFLSSIRGKGNTLTEETRKHVQLPQELSNDRVDAATRADFIGSNHFFGGLDSQSFSPSLPMASSSKDNGSVRSVSGDVDSAEDDSIKVDSVTDFRSALKAGFGEIDDDALIFDGSQTGSKAAISLVKAFSGPQGMNRRWMTAPIPGLATIREDGDDGGDESTNVMIGLPSPTAKRMKDPLDSLDTELVVKAAQSPVKQMRVPRVSKKFFEQEQTDIVDIDKFQQSYPGIATIPTEAGALIYSDVGEVSVSKTSATISDNLPGQLPQRSLSQRSSTLPSTDAEIEKAGSSFLDAVEMSLGLGGIADLGASTGQDDYTGKAHHRKTRSKCSIDWSIPNDDIRRFAVDNSTHANPPALIEDPKNEFNDSMTTLSGAKQRSVKLPIFIDRLVALKRGKPSRVGRWFPFTYEVIILQWVGVLNEQRKNDASNSTDAASQTTLGVEEEPLADAASRSAGVAIACAPVLLEIIKQSLGWRIDNIHRRAGERSTEPLLVTLDDSLMTGLERIVESISLACIDFRNFDAWETRQTCIDVNDSLVWFLRDMFGFLNPDCAYRLVIIYLSNLLSTAGNLYDRDSSTGLRCSWEVTKLQLNAMSAFVRFPDLITINSPQFNSLNESLLRVPGFSKVSFFDEMLKCYENFQCWFPDGSAPLSKDLRMRPHWLIEIIADVCLLGIEHAEQNIQRRSSSLLQEMFWTQSQESTMEGNSTIIASMHVTFLEKVLSRTNYISKCFSEKNQVRQDILRCVVFVLQSAPGGLLRALWRKLCSKSSGKSFNEKYGGVGYSVINDFENGQEVQPTLSRAPNDWKQEADIFEMFGLINLALASFEYEGTDEHALAETFIGDHNPWQKEYLSSLELDTPAKAKQRRLNYAFGRTDTMDTEGEAEYATTSSRRWHAHDGSIVLIKTAQQIVRELRNVLETSEEGQSLLNPARTKRAAKHNKKHDFGTQTSTNGNHINFNYVDAVIFVRAAVSVYLHALTLEESDITLVKTFNASLEIIKIFGIKIFNQAVGETLQHWMRVVTFHCGSRRAEVRVQASDFLEFLLRSTWDSFGSLFRIRLPFLAVQTEVMEKIVATAAGRHYGEQRMMGLGMEPFTNGSAEASLAPLWRTLDRLHHQSASQNVAFKSALMSLAEKVKKLFRAYVAAHALAFLQQTSKPSDLETDEEDGAVNGAKSNLEMQPSIRASNISIHRVINASAGYSKQFLGFYSTSMERSAVVHNEAVEDAFLAAADVFSPTELPDHRVAWLRRLAHFHSVRRKYAEEATCHYNIHITLQHASTLHGSLWFSTPFLPWTNMRSDRIHLDGGEGPIADSNQVDDNYHNDFGREIEKTNSFRRIFYRNENSVRVTGGESDAGASKFAFYGVTLPSDYNTVNPWTSMREMEASMLEEAEAAGDLFLKSGIVASSRYAWGLAVRHYADKFCYGKLKHVYENLARTVVSEVPPLDLNQQEISVTVPLGRFYRVWFHGGAPDELIGAEFVYRTASTVKLEQFGQELKEVIRCIIPDNTPIHLVLDGRAEEDEPRSFAGFRLGAQLEPVRVKVTPLRSMVRKSNRMRGLPEWFHDYIESAFRGQPSRSSTIGGAIRGRSDSLYSDNGVSDPGNRPRHHDVSSYSSSAFSSAGSATVFRGTSHVVGGEGGSRFKNEAFEGELVGADKFSFMQPISKGRDRGAKDWLRGSSGDFAAKSLRVTQLQVGQTFPACVSRQAVVHRVVFTQSPLEAASDSICQWCSILFRTAIATNGQAVLGTNPDPGIGIDASKVVSDCIHSSRVKEMGLYLLKKDTNFEEEEEGDALQTYDRLSEDEVKRWQLRLARSLVVFMELLHLLIARNREMLLDVIQERKRDESSSRHSHSTSLVSLSDVRSTRSTVTRQSSMNGNDSRAESFSERESSRQLHGRKGSGVGLANDDSSVASAFTTDKARTDSAIGIQSELQRAFIALCKDIQPRVFGVMGSESPRWLKLCAQDNYFSAYVYRNVKIAMEEELAFDGIDSQDDGDDSDVKQPASSGGRSQSSHEGMSFHGRAASVTKAPGSPGGSLGSESFASQSSDAGRSQQSSKRSISRVIS